MNIIQSILGNYGNFFSLHELIAELSKPESWGIILTLVIMEGLLSADNALVLATMVGHLPHKEQKHALMWGMGGAYLFRFVAIGVGTYLIKLWFVKLIGALYLLHMVYSYFKNKNKETQEEVKPVNKGLWATIASVELMDIAFSIDSVTASLGISDKVWVLFLGAIFGILMMRGVAQVFVSLIAKVPELETSAYILIMIIGIRMILELIHIEIPEYLFYGLLVTIFGGTFVLHKIKDNKRNNIEGV
jgi:YkoY family integral membrane protein